MKNKFIAGGAIIIAVALLAIGTAAYLVSEARVTNIITTGTVEIQLDEYSEYYEPGSEWQNVFYENPEEPVVPGETIAKIPVVTNAGTADCWVRVKLTLDLTLLPEFEGETEVNPEDWVTIDFVSGYEGNWQEEGGWYYLKTPLAPGEETPLLFDSVALKPEMGNGFQEITLDVLAEAIQSKNNPLVGSYAGLWIEE